MSGRDKAFGGILCLLALVIGVAYFYALFTPYWVWVLKAVLSVFMIIILVVIFWVGYTIATTPSIEEIEKGAKRKKKK